MHCAWQHATNPVLGELLCWWRHPRPVPGSELVGMPYGFQTHHPTGAQTMASTGSAGVTTLQHMPGQRGLGDVDTSIPGKWLNPHESAF